MSISKHSNDLASTNEFKCNNKKQDNRLSNHHFPLHLPEKTKHHSSETRYAVLKWYSINFQGGLRDATNRRWVERINKCLGEGESTLAGI